MLLPKTGSVACLRALSIAENARLSYVQGHVLISWSIFATGWKTRACVRKAMVVQTRHVYPRLLRNRKRAPNGCSTQLHNRKRFRNSYSNPPKVTMALTTAARRMSPWLIPPSFQLLSVGPGRGERAKGIEGGKGEGQRIILWNDACNTLKLSRSSSLCCYFKLESKSVNSHMSLYLSLTSWSKPRQSSNHMLWMDFTD